MMGYADFLVGFPEFNDGAAYPQATVEFWLSQAPNNVSERRMGRNFSLAVMLYTAHNLVISTRDRQSAGKGAVPGAAFGAIASKSIDAVSVSYDTTVGTDAGAGAWNSSSYGQRLYRLLRSTGAGASYVAPPSRFAR